MKATRPDGPSGVFPNVTWVPIRALLHEPATIPCVSDVQHCTSYSKMQDTPTLPTPGPPGARAGCLHDGSPAGVTDLAAPVGSPTMTRRGLAAPQQPQAPVLNASGATGGPVPLRRRHRPCGALRDATAWSGCWQWW